MKSNQALAVIGALVLLLASLGCTMLQRIAKVDMLDGDNAAKAASAIKQKIGGGAHVIRAEVRPDKMEVTVRSNKNPKDIDKYVYANGTVSGPEPVQVISLGPIEMTGDRHQTIEIEEIGWANLPAAVAKAKELSKLEDAGINLVSMDFESPTHTVPENEIQINKSKGRPDLVFTWRLFVEGPRGRKYFWADKNGKLNETAY